jgi:Bacteriophage baseplate protein W
MAQDNSFLGIGWAFPIRFDDINLDSHMVSKEDDIYESLKILFGTHPGERVMQPSFGCNLRQFAHEIPDSSLFAQIREVMGDAILRFEARIDVDNINIEYDGGRDGILYITVEYTIRQTNSRHNMVYPFYLLEGNNISSLTS